MFNQAPGRQGLINLQFAVNDYLRKRISQGRDAALRNCSINTKVSD